MYDYYKLNIKKINLPDICMNIIKLTLKKI